MDPITLAVGLFITIASGMIAYGYDNYKQTEEKEQNDKLLGLQEKNLALNEKTASMNFDLSQRQFEYQKQLNQLQMDREDTAFQRQVADLKAAGLSPLMVAGSGATSAPLTSAQAPQMDISGINQALSNYVGSYNDIFNRRLQRQTFAMQSRVQKAQMFTQLAELGMQENRAKLENRYLKDKMDWEKEHGYRDLDWRSELINFAENYLKDKSDKGSIIDGAKGAAQDVGGAVQSFLDTQATASDNNDFGSFGSVEANTGYGHMLDNVNYANDRSTGKLIKEELIEKKNKFALKRKDTQENRSKLYDSDDYLKKHISKDKWLSMPADFISYYLKNGMFEGHKSYW